MRDGKMVGMTPDIEQIRAVVIAATTGRASARRDVARQRLSDNAPSWLAALCDEVERLRADRAMAEHGDLSVARHRELVAERDAALARVAELEALVAADAEHGPWWKGEA